MFRHLRAHSGSELAFELGVVIAQPGFRFDARAIELIDFGNRMARN